ncbi:MAG: IS30 family transposase [Candidatus Magasanikbacteria bacterium]|nr:IS30 family transposase [Candidatus Magasanikbacteria bacterium]
MKKQKQYTHINSAERKEIAFLLRKGYGLGDIANVLRRGKSSVSEEIRRNSTRAGYDPEKAQHKAYVRRKYSKYQGMKVVGNRELRNYIEKKLTDDWSPEEISGRLREIDTHLPYASFRVIYKFVSSVYGRLLKRHLRYKGKKRKSKSRTPVTKLGGRVFIDQRPKIVENKERFGDWEGDFIVSGKQGKGILVVLHERKARFTLIKRIIKPNMRSVYRYIFEITGGVIMNTLTLDNDIIFRKHEELSRLLGAPVYFCHPYHSWEKGGVENTNKLIRQYITKGSDISRYSDEYIQTIQDKLNARPRKCLNYKTPFEVMIENQQFKKLNQIFQQKYAIINLKQKQPSVRLEGSM